MARVRGEHNKLYDSPLWRRLRAKYLASTPLCERCQANRPPRDTPANTVHHKKAHGDNMDLFLAWDNLESICQSCHSGSQQVADNTGYSQACGIDGWPTDSRHPSNLRRK
jgi:5-methylcytosine-specific restriction protein A